MATEAQRKQSNARARKYYWADVEKSRIHRRKYDALNRVKRRAYARKSTRKATLRKYGLTPQAYNDLLVEQGGRCAVCRDERDSMKGDWHIDHNHATGKLRGLLCIRCNHGIGQFKDDPFRLEKAAQYLRKHELKELV